MPEDSERLNEIKSAMRILVKDIDAYIIEATEAFKVKDWNKIKSTYSQVFEANEQLMNLLDQIDRK